MVNAARLHGVHVALATPIGPDGRIDHAGLDRLLQRVTDGGVTGVCPAGSTGEGPRLGRDQRVELTEAVRRRLGADRLVVPCASAMTVSEAIGEIEELANAGADAVLLAPPSYYPLDADGVHAWYAAVADRSACPIVLYNIPAMTKITISPEVVASLAQTKTIIGIKDSSRDFEYLQSVHYATDHSDFATLTGSDTMLVASLLAGAVGTIAASANLVPELGTSIHRAALAGDLYTARMLQRRLHAVVMACRVGTPPAGWKAALAWAGVCGDSMVPPAPGLGAPARADLERRLADLEIGR